MKLLLPFFFLLFSQSLLSQIIKVNDDLSFSDYTYNKATIIQNKITKVLIDKQIGGKTSSKMSFLFNNDGCLTQEIITNSIGQKTIELLFSYNNYYDLLSLKSLDSNLKKAFTVTYYKNYEGSKLVKDSSNMLAASYNYFYDSLGRQSKEVVHLNFDNFIVRTYLNKYDSTGKMIEIIETEELSKSKKTNHIVSHRMISYNKIGKPSHEEELIKNDIHLAFNNSSIKYSYDDSGNLIEIINGDTFFYTYTYDEKGLVSSKNMGMIMNGKQIVSEDKYTYEFHN